jgi:hypothetical protein
MLVLLVLVVPARAADPIFTDRPDIAEGSRVVDRGAVQLEQGVALDGPGSTVSFPSLTRVGVGHDLEVRLETPVLAIGDGGAAFDGVAVGGKWHAYDTDGGPSVGVLVHAEFDGDFGFAPVAKVACDLDLPAGLELGLNVGGTVAGGGVGGLWAVAVGRPLTDVFRVYVEASGAVASGVAVTDFDAGASYLVNDDVQLDLSGLYGLAGNYGAGAGVSVRWP